MLGLLLLRGAPFERRPSPLIAWLQRGYDGMLARSLNAPRAALVTALVVVAAGLAVWPWLGQSLLPSFKERNLRIDWVGAPGTSHPAMLRVMTRASSELRTIPGVSGAYVHLGRAITGDQVVDVNSSQLWVSIDPKADYDATVAAVQDAVDGYPGVARSVQSYLTDRIREVLAGAGQSIVVRINGKKRDVLRAKAEEVRQALADIEGIVDLHVDGYVEQPQVQIKVDLAAAEPYGIKPGDVRRAAATMFAGLGVGSLFEEQKVYDVVVWGTPESRNSLSDVRALLLDAPRGGHVRLGDVADVRIAATPTVINHEALSNRIDIVAGVRGRDLSAVVEAVENRLDEIQFPVEYYPVLLGETAEREAAEERLLSFALAVGVGILLLLHAAFRSWRLAGLFFLGLPVAVAGGVIRGAAGWRDDLARVAHGLPRRPGRCHTPGHHADQALSESRGTWRRVLRAGAGAAGHAGAVRIHRGDGADHSRGHAAPGAARQHRGARDRSPDRDGHSRRSRHRDPVQPPPRAGAVLAIWRPA